MSVDWRWRLLYEAYATTIWSRRERLSLVAYIIRRSLEKPRAT